MVAMDQNGAEIRVESECYIPVLKVTQGIS
jgi:hypothetical protein